MTSEAPTLYTMDQLLELLNQDDPITDPERPEDTVVTGNRVFIKGEGVLESDYADDLRIEIRDGVLYLDWAEHGTDDWYSERVCKETQTAPGWMRFDTFEELHTWIYEL